MIKIEDWIKLNNVWNWQKCVILISHKGSKEEKWNNKSVKKRKRSQQLYLKFGRSPNSILFREQYTIAKFQRNSIVYWKIQQM